jgi:hypothetical protein
VGSEREEVDLNARSTRSHNQATDWRLVRKYGGGKHLDADLLSPQPDILRRLLCSLVSQLTVFIACFSNKSIVIGEQRIGEVGIGVAELRRAWPRRRKLTALGRSTGGFHSLNL